MALMLRDGDYVPDGDGGLRTVEGGAALLQRVLWKLSVRRGSFPFLPELGSDLHRLLRERPSARPALARRWAAEALADEEDLTVTGAALSPGEGDGLTVTMSLDWRGAALSGQVEIRP